MALSFADQIKDKFKRITLAQTFEDSVKRELDNLSMLTDDVALVVVGHLYVEQQCRDILGAFFNYEFSRSHLDHTEYSQLTVLLRLSNLLDERVLESLTFLGRLRNRFAHNIVSLKLLDRKASEKDNELVETFRRLCKSLRVNGANVQEQFIDFLKIVRVQLRRAELLAKEMSRYVTTQEYIDSLEPIRI